MEIYIYITFPFSLLCRSPTVAISTFGDLEFGKLLYITVILSTNLVFIPSSEPL